MFLVESLKALYEHDEQERIMDKLIEALIGPHSKENPGKKPTKTGNWDRNVLSHLNMALLGKDDTLNTLSADDNTRIPDSKNPNVAVVPAINKLISALIGPYSKENPQDPEKPTITGLWDRNMLSHLNMALLGKDDKVTPELSPADDNTRKPDNQNPNVAVVPAMNKLISALIGPYAEENANGGSAVTGHWDRNILTHLNLALLGKDDDSTDISRKPTENKEPVALVPAMNEQSLQLNGISAGLRNLEVSFTLYLK